MSNGAPERNEGGPEGPPGVIVVAAFLYSVLWIGVVFASLLFDLSILVRVRWVPWASVVLLLASLYVLAREMGFVGPTRHGRG